MRATSLLALVLVVASCGCAGYRFGPSNGRKAGAQSVQITPFVDHSAEPGLADELTFTLRKAIQRDGTFRLATHADGDLVLTGVLSDYRRRELSLSITDVRTVTDYQVSVIVQVTVRERASGRIVLERSITGTALLRVGEDFGSSERQIVPVLAQDVARQITDLLADDGW